jgi:hypothetical protein
MPARLLRGFACLFAAVLLAGLPRTGPLPDPASAQQAVTVTYHAGWNLVGGPAGTMLAGVQGDLWTLAPDGSGYVRAAASTPLTAGTGYWALFLADTPVTLPAAPVQGLQLSLPAGVWTIAGNPSSAPVTLSGADAAYGFDPTSGYTPLSVLQPGRAALVYAGAGGTLAIAPAAIAPDTITSIAPPAPAAPPANAPPAAAVSETAGGVTVLASGVGQAKPGGPVTVAALVRNDGPAVDLTPIEATVYDANGTVIAAGGSTLHYLATGEVTGFAGRFSTHAFGAAARATIQLGQGRPVGAPEPGDFSFSDVTLVGNRSGLDASAVLTSTYATDATDVRVYAIAYDNSSAIVGGGAIILRFVPANGSTGVIVPLDFSTTLARVDLYANLP